MLGLARTGAAASRQAKIKIQTAFISAPSQRPLRYHRRQTGRPHLAVEIRDGTVRQGLPLRQRRVEPLLVRLVDLALRSGRRAIAALDVRDLRGEDAGDGVEVLLRGAGLK